MSWLNFIEITLSYDVVAPENKNKSESDEMKEIITNEQKNNEEGKEKIIRQTSMEIPPSSSLEKLNINDLGNNKNIGRMPFSAPVKSNKEEHLKEFGLSNTSIDKLNRRNSYDQYVIRLNEPMPDGSPHKIASIRPFNNITILSNNYTTTIDFKKPQLKDEDSRLLKDFLSSVDPKNVNYEKEEEDEDDPSPDYSNRIEKFKMTGESSSSLNILLENVDIKCSTNSDHFPRNTSSESLESIEFCDATEDQKNSQNASWFSSLSKSFQTWMNQKNDPDYEKYFTTTDKYGNIHVMPVKTIMRVYNIEFDQAVSIHDYVCSIIPKFPDYITSYTKYVENLNNNDPKENKTLELIYKHQNINPIITSDLALKLQPQLPLFLRGNTRWTMQYSLTSSINLKESTGLNKSDNLTDLIEASQNSGGACLLIIQDDNNYVFGVFMNEELHNDEEYYGTHNWFLWKYKNSKLEVFRPDENEDSKLILCNSNAFSIGGV
ncbi:hypothetical protein PIROE2DRAFT_15219 [Piromyces sp. E2]|nr:hypothetical protein PIROE2DRAFT_15219 [Piromyces sp. E2]|eukprot:OUM59275.1 hypothetical protein PIROE2DRAFT_15219 [Piromyces sp. E2]